MATEKKEEADDERGVRSPHVRSPHVDAGARRGNQTKAKTLADARPRATVAPGRALSPNSICQACLTEQTPEEKL